MSVAGIPANARAGERPTPTLQSKIARKRSKGAETAGKNQKCKRKIPAKGFFQTGQRHDIAEKPNWSRPRGPKTATRSEADEARTGIVTSTRPGQKRTRAGKGINQSGEGDSSASTNTQPTRVCATVPTPAPSTPQSPIRRQGMKNERERGMGGKKTDSAGKGRGIASPRPHPSSGRVRTYNSSPLISDQFSSPEC